MKGFELFYSGVVRHLGQIERETKDKATKWVEHVLTMEHISHGGSPVLTKFKISKEAIKNGYLEKLEKFIGKDVKFSSFIKSRVYNDKIYEDFYFTGFGQ